MSKIHEQLEKNNGIALKASTKVISKKKQAQRRKEKLLLRAHHQEKKKVIVMRTWHFSSRYSRES